MMKLLLAQFLTALADNAILFIAVAMVMQGVLKDDWYIPALQASFLVAFVVLAPWVGPFADLHSKTWVLQAANLIKAAGAGLMLLHVNPLLAYAVVGLGAAVYSPAKYGVLPELVSSHELVRANGWVEGSTIVAILLGTVAGAMIADHSIRLALLFVLLLYLASAIVAKWMTRLPSTKMHHANHGLNGFRHTLRILMHEPRARFAMFGVSLFWASAVVLRLVIIAWASLILLLTSSTEISLLTLFIALGIAVGALLAPRWLSMENMSKTRFAAYGMGGCILLLLFVDVGDLWLARILLFFIGIAGGLFVVPINAVLQDIGHRSVGSGHAVAAQHFFENLAMLASTGIYTWSSSVGVSPVVSIWVLGVFMMLMTMFISLRFHGE